MNDEFSERLPDARRRQTGWTQWSVGSPLTSSTRGPIPGARQRVDRCIEACVTCAEACRACVDAATDSANTAEIVRVCLDCALLCEFCITDMRNGSPLLIYSSRMSACACELCALGCDQHETEPCTRCAETCRQCAHECRELRLWLGEIQSRAL